MKSNNALSYITSILTTIFGLATANEITAVIYSILGLVSFLFSIAYTIYKWYKKSNSDNYISADEMEELMEELKEEIDKQKKGN